MKLDKFLKDTGIVFFATILTSIFNLLYQLFMVRSLDPVSFGILNTLLSLMLIIAVPAGTLQTIATKFIASFKAHNNRGKINVFLLLFFKKVFIISLLIFLGFLIFSKQIAGFFKIQDNVLIIMVGVIMMLATILPFNLGSLQGLQKFKSLSFVSIVSGGFRLFFGVILVSLGFQLKGALGAIMLATIMAVLFSFIPLWSYFIVNHKDTASFSKEKLDLLSIYKYILPVLIALPSFYLLTNMDIILVKRFFSPVEAGFYSIAQMVGKIILFLPGAITIVMFPKVSEYYTKKEDTIPILKKCLTVVGILCFSASFFCIMFPKFILNLLSGKVYIECIPLIAPFSISMSFFALGNVFLYYHLSVHNAKFTPLFLLCALVQMALIILFHNSLVQVLYILTGVSILLFLINSFIITKAVKI